MPAGRPPHPDEYKKIKGTYKPSRSTGKEVAFAPKIPKKRGRPKKHKEVSGLSSVAQDMFTQSVAIMEQYKILTEWDINMITIMCNEYDTYISVKDMPTIEYNAETGMSTVHASVRVKKIALDNFMKIAQSLSLTAVMRMRIRIKDDQEDEDPMAKILGG
jgi:phage terminase small subunit